MTKSFYIRSKRLDENTEFGEDIKKYGSGTKESLYLAESTFDQIKIGFQGKLKYKNRVDKIEFIENELIITDWVWNWADAIAVKFPKLLTGEKISLISYDNPLELEIEPIRASVKKNNFKKGEFVKAQGILQAKIKKIIEEPR